MATLYFDDFFASIGDNQKFSLDRTTGGLKIQQDQNQCLDFYVVEGKANLWECTGSANQKFIFPESFWPDVIRSTYYHSTAGGDYCFEWDEAYNTVLLRPCDYMNQKQLFTRFGNQISSALDPRMCIEKDAATRDVFLAKCSNGLNQQWISDPSTNMIKLVEDPDLCLDYYVGDKVCIP